MTHEYKIEGLTEIVTNMLKELEGIYDEHGPDEADLQGLAALVNIQASTLESLLLVRDLPTLAKEAIEDTLAASEEIAGCVNRLAERVDA